MSLIDLNLPTLGMINSSQKKEFSKDVPLLQAATPFFTQKHASIPGSE
jgi:hypothetical protein